MTTIPALPTHSVFDRLEPLLAQVNKPIQYVGGEHNSVVKDWEDVAVRWCLSYPDAYEVGQPNQGVAILYEILNERDWILAERTYSIWPDMEAQMRSAGVPQFTLDAHRPVALFDVLGVSFSTELGYTNLLNLIDLSGLTLHAAERGEEEPIIVAGGHAAFNPGPSPTSSTPRCWATARRRRCSSPTSSASGRQRAARAVATACSSGCR